MDLSNLSAHSAPLELLPTLIDRVAKEDPQRTWAIHGGGGGFSDISYATAARAIDRVAHFLESELGKLGVGLGKGSANGKKEEEFPVIAYLGPPDVRYYILPIALVKCGCVALLLSDQTPEAVQSYLLDASKCAALLIGYDIDTDSSNMLPSSLPIPAHKRIQIPSVQSLLADGAVEHYPYSKTPEQGLNDPGLVIHTSGTTSLHGRPKLIVFKLGNLAQVAAYLDVPNQGGQPSYMKDVAEYQRRWTGFRIAHGAGVFNSYQGMYLGVAQVVIGTNPTSIETVEAVLNYANVESITVPPVTLENIIRHPHVLNKLSTLRQVYSAGGPLSTEIGNIVRKVCLLRTGFASTETHPLWTHTTAPEDWQYIHFNNEYSGLEWRQYPEDDPHSTVYEAVVVRHPDPVRRRLQNVFWIFTELEEWSLGDLFEKHPSKENHWKHVGRKDDMIILNNGVNVVPVHFEKNVFEKDARVSKAVMYGNGKGHLAVLIELRDAKANGEMQDVREGMWGLAQECNAQLPRTTQFVRRSVVIARHDKPLPRTGKGDVQRKRAEAMYADELEQAFAKA